MGIEKNERPIDEAKEEKGADPTSIAERLGIAYDTASVNRVVSTSETGEEDLGPKDWYRNRDPYFGGEIEINERPIQEFSSITSHPEYAEFQTKEGLKNFFREVCLKNFTRSAQEKESAVDYLYETFNQANYMRPLEQSLAFVAVSRQFTPLAETRSSLLSITSTKNGVSITETIRYEGITVDKDHPLMPFAFSDNLAPEKKGKHLIEGSSTLEIDFSKNASVPQLISKDNQISFGHGALEAFVLTGSINDYLIQGHLNEYEELKAQLKFFLYKNEIENAVNTYVGFIYKKIGDLLKNKEKNQDQIIILGSLINDLVLQVQIMKATHPQSPDVVEVLEKLKASISMLGNNNLLSKNNVASFVRLLDSLIDGLNRAKYEAKPDAEEQPVLWHFREEPSIKEEPAVVQWHEQKKTQSDVSEEPSTQSLSDEDIPSMPLGDFFSEAEQEREIARQHAADIFITSSFELPKEKEVLLIELQYRLNQLEGKTSPVDKLLNTLYEKALDVIRADGEKIELDPLKMALDEIKGEINRLKHHKVKGSGMFSSHDFTISYHDFTSAKAMALSASFNLLELKDDQHTVVKLTLNSSALKTLAEALKLIDEVVEAYGEGPSLAIHT